MFFCQTTVSWLYIIQLTGDRYCPCIILFTANQHGRIPGRSKGVAHFLFLLCWPPQFAFHSFIYEEYFSEAWAVRHHPSVIFDFLNSNSSKCRSLESIFQQQYYANTDCVNSLRLPHMEKGCCVPLLYEGGCMDDAGANIQMEFLPSTVNGPTDGPTVAPRRPHRHRIAWLGGWSKGPWRPFSTLCPGWNKAKAAFPATTLQHSDGN